MGEFKVVSPFEPQGDQPEAIVALSEGVKRGDRLQVLLGRHRQRQDLHHGEGDRAGAKAYSCHRP